MELLNDHIKEYLEYYISTQSNPEFAILLKGKWGSGKSWFIRNFIDKHQDKNFLYVSLYGVITTKEIEERIFEQLHPILSSKTAKIAGSILRSIIKTTIKIDINSDKKDDVSILSQIPDLKLPDYLTDTNKKVLIFDDLERCSLSINTVLGFINQFVENQDQRVILIANEEELILKFSEDKNTGSETLYLKIKEKLIGQTFEIRTDLDTAIDCFIDNLQNNNDCKLQLNKKKLLLKNILNDSKYPNLRHLRQTILSFERFWNYIPSEAFIKDLLIEHIIHIFFTASFQIKQGNVEESKLESKFNSTIQNLIYSEKSIISYSFKGVYHMPFEIKLLQDFFVYGKMEESEFHNSILNGYYFFDSKTPNWQKLWYFIKLEEEEFKNLFSLVLKNFKNREINNVLELIQITGMFLNFSKSKIINISKETILSSANKNLENISKFLILDYSQIKNFDSHFLNTGSHNLGYYSLDDKEFEQFKNIALNILRKGNTPSYPLLAKNLMIELKSNLKLFTEKIFEGNSNHSIYSNIPIFIHFEIPKFLKILYSLKNQEIILLSDALEDRYQHTLLREELAEEKDWLIELKSKIELDMVNFNKKIKKHNIQTFFIPALEKSIELFKTKYH